MPIVLAKCTECGGTIKVESEKKLGVCENCGQPFVVEEAINNFTNFYEVNYITNNNTTNNYGDGTVVNIYENENKEFIVEAGVLKKYTGADDNIIIPTNVKAIGEACFEEMSIVAVKLHDGIKRIENAAFWNCKQLKKINIPKSVEYIGEACFFGCSELEEIVLEGNISGLQAKTQYHYYGPFDSYTQHWGAFEGCSKLSKVIFSEEQKSIPAYCFDGCHLDQLYVPKSCEIGSNSFEGCTLKKVILERTAQLNTNLLSKITVNTLIIKDIVDYDNSILNEINPQRVLIDCDTEDENEQLAMIQKVRSNLNGDMKEMSVRTNKTKDYLVWKSLGNCQYCGGVFDYPLLGKPKCRNCGKKKDY